MKSYNISCEISEPVLLNCWKHHAGFIKSRIKDYRNSPEADLTGLRSEILSIGESLMDLYLGELTPDQIASSIINYATENKILTRSAFTAWLREDGNDYGIVEIQDGSKWTLRQGENKKRYIHIHPSRYSIHTLRVRSSALKSAIIYCVLNNPSSEDTLSFINRIRKEYLELPPLKNLKSAASLLNLIGILT